MKLQCTVSVCMPLWVMVGFIWCESTLNDTDGRCSRRETCDQSSQISHVSFCTFFSRNAWILFFLMPRSQFLFFYVLTSCKFIFYSPQMEFKLIGIPQKTVALYGTLLEGTNYTCVECWKHAPNTNQHKEHRVHIKYELFKQKNISNSLRFSLYSFSFV